MKTRFLSLLTLAVVLIVPAAGALAQTDDSVDGLWQTNGYGAVVQISGGQIAVYENTSVSCLKLGEGSPEDIGLILSLEANQLVIRNAMIKYITAHRIDALPDQCQNGGTQPTDDPEFNFEVFWNTFNEQYAFFDLYEVDWQQRYETFRPQVTAETTPDELFAILSEMIAPLHDNHISLTYGTRRYSPGLPPEWITGDFDWLKFVSDFVSTIGKDYLGSDLRYSAAAGEIVGDESMMAHPNVFYGALNDTTGYINILSMTDYGDSQLDTVGDIMDQIIEAFDGMDTIIVDVRLNGGGQDAVALAFASRFADEKRLAFTKQARDGDGLTPEHALYVEPAGPRQFTGKVIVLTSSLTASAAEVFLMAMQPFPYVTIIGETTSGGYSDILFRQLPNGWSFGLSNEVYRASDGQIYERIGFPPDVIVPLSPEGFAEGTDAILDAALELAAVP